MGSGALVLVWSHPSINAFQAHLFLPAAAVQTAITFDPGGATRPTAYARKGLDGPHVVASVVNDPGALFWTPIGDSVSLRGAFHTFSPHRDHVSSVERLRLDLAWSASN